jgi:hypothetical protein
MFAGEACAHSRRWSGHLLPIGDTRSDFIEKAQIPRAPSRFSFKFSSIEAMDDLGIAMSLNFKAQILAAATIALASPAFAADLPTKKAPVAPPPVFTWTGLYIGFNSGYAWADSETVNVGTVNLVDNSLLNFGPASAAGGTGTVRARLNGFFFGGQIGYNWQFSERLIAGLEADI